jgi:hypothetical protein
VPFLRVIRDKRGYETTYLMHWFRDGTRQRSRILYVFRTPGGVRVGRDPFEPAVLREIEAGHPDIAFEWKAIRDNLQVIEPPVERRRRPRSDDGGAPEGQAPRAAAAPAAPAPAPEPAERPKPIPGSIEGGSADEQLAFLAEWYPVVRERIEKRFGDPSRRETLLTLAERLNGSAWTDVDQITSGLQQAGEALERLSHIFARRRRRGRRRPTEHTSAPPSAEPS